MTNRNINAATLLEQYSILVEKEQWGRFFYTAGYCERVIRLLLLLPITVQNHKCIMHWD